MTRFARPAWMLLVALVAALAVARPAFAAPEGQLSWGVHITLAPTYFDPAETPGLVTPFMILYALHDALVVLPIPVARFAFATSSPISPRNLASPTDNDAGRHALCW